MIGFTKPSTYAHNDKAQFSLAIDSFINKLTSHHWHTTKSKQVCFCLDYFLRHVMHTLVLRWPWNGCELLTVVVIHWFGYFSWCLKHKRSSFAVLFRHIDDFKRMTHLPYSIIIKTTTCNGVHSSHNLIPN